MLLHHRDIIDRIPTAGTLIYDWHYRADVSDESVKFFKEHGFEVVGCPALVCAPHMILPSDQNYTNIRRFAEIARAQDILGIDTTIWIPTRYLSDALWPGIAYAAVHSWARSNWDEPAFYRSFMHELLWLTARAMRLPPPGKTSMRSSGVWPSSKQAAGTMIRRWQKRGRRPAAPTEHRPSPI